MIVSCSMKNHKYGFIDDMVQKYQSVLDGELQPAHKQISNILQEISASESVLQSTKNAQLRTVDTSFDALLEIIADERKEAIEKLFQVEIDHNFSKKSEVLVVS